jgi:hypothetical protein
LPGVPSLPLFPLHGLPGLLLHGSPGGTWSVPLSFAATGSVVSTTIPSTTRTLLTVALLLTPSNALLRSATRIGVAAMVGALASTIGTPCPRPFEPALLPGEVATGATWMSKVPLLTTSDPLLATLGTTIAAAWPFAIPFGDALAAGAPALFA